MGGAMIDTIAVIADDRIERMTLRNADTSYPLLEVGRESEAEEMSTHCRGGAVNAAVAMARPGFDVSVLIKEGRDFRSDTIRKRLARFVECLCATGPRWIVSTDGKDGSYISTPSDVTPRAGRTEGACAAGRPPPRNPRPPMCRRFGGAVDRPRLRR